MRQRRYEDLDHHIGEQVRLLAWRRKIPVTVLAERAGVGYTTLTRKMHGGTTWAAGDLVSVAAALGARLARAKSSIWMERRSTRASPPRTTRPPPPLTAVMPHE